MPGATFRRVGDHVTRAIAGETIVVPIRAKAADLDWLYVFNDSGAAIWALLASPRSVDELAREIAFEFDVEDDAARADVLSFLEKLQGAGLVDEGPAAA